VNCNIVEYQHIIIRILASQNFLDLTDVNDVVSKH